MGSTPDSITWLHDWDETFEIAKHTDRVVLVDVEKED